MFRRNRVGVSRTGRGRREVAGKESYIGRKNLTDKIWAVSIMRKSDSEHAFLIIEGIKPESQEHFVLRTDLFLKDGAPELTSSLFPGMTLRSESTIVPKPISYAELLELRGLAQYQSWGISATQASKLLDNIDEDVALSQEGGMGYCLAGDSSIYGSSFLSKASYHNCVSWCQAQLRKIGLPIQKSWSDLVVRGTNVVPGLEESAESTTLSRQ